MVAITTFISTLVFIFLILASIQDIKEREVYDLISMGLLIIILSIKLIISLETGWNYFFSALLGFAIMLIIATFLYYQGGWGGADSKVLMAMGALLGADFTFPILKESSQFNGLEIPFFLLLLLFIGSAWSLFWSAKVMTEHWKLFKKEAKKRHRKLRRLFYLSILVAIILGIFSYKIDPSLLIFPIVLPLLYPFFIFLTAVEASCFYIYKSPLDLVPGDWLSQKVKENHKMIVKKKTLERDDIEKIQMLFANGKIETVKIKEGVPFLPSFLTAYAVFIFSSPIFYWLTTIL